MKILVLQLARLGDIYQTWPTLHALKRTHPGTELHFLTRSKFAGAAPDFEKLGAKPGGAGGLLAEALVDRHWVLDTRDVLAPLIDEKPAIDTSLQKLDEFCALLKEEKFDRIINLSFSAFSSFLTGQIAASDTVVNGYTRFSDGYLSIPDDGSAYFYAQVGPGRANRLHLTDIFAHVAGVELTDADWAFPRGAKSAPEEQTILVHVGASSLDKTLSWSKWLQVVKGLLASPWRGTVVLIGAKEESALAQKIAAVSGDRRPVNLVGETTLAEVFAMVGEASLVIGGDSAPVQMASLVSTPVLNISLPMVSFWETGPRAKGSRILPIESEQAVSAEEIVIEAVAMLAGKSTSSPALRVPGPTAAYVEMRPQAREMEWELLRAMYLGAEFPAPPHELFQIGMKRLADVNQLAIEQIEALRRNPRNKTASDILDRVDELIAQIAKMVPESEILIRWFTTERLRIGPMTVAELTVATENAHRRFADVIAIYVPNSETAAAVGDAEGELG